MKWVGFVCVCAGEHLESGWTASWEQSRWGESSLREAAGRATSSLCLLRGKFLLLDASTLPNEKVRIWKE